MKKTCVAEEVHSTKEEQNPTVRFLSSLKNIPSLEHISPISEVIKPNDFVITIQTILEDKLG